MSYHDLRDFMAQLEQAGELRRVAQPVSPNLEMTALCDRVLRAGGPAILFENPTGYTMPVLGNLFGTPERVARAMGVDRISGLRPDGLHAIQNALVTDPVGKEAIQFARNKAINVKMTPFITLTDGQGFIIYKHFGLVDQAFLEREVLRAAR